MTAVTKKKIIVNIPVSFLHKLTAKNKLLHLKKRPFAICHSETL